MIKIYLSFIFLTMVFIFLNAWHDSKIIKWSGIGTDKDKAKAGREWHSISALDFMLLIGVFSVMFLLGTKGFIWEFIRMIFLGAILRWITFDLILNKMRCWPLFYKGKTGFIESKFKSWRVYWGVKFILLAIIITTFIFWR